MNTLHLVNPELRAAIGQFPDLGFAEGHLAHLRAGMDATLPLRGHLKGTRHDQ